MKLAFAKGIHRGSGNVVTCYRVVSETSIFFRQTHRLLHVVEGR